MDKIDKCRECTLCDLQRPMTDYKTDADVIIVGMSAKIKKYEKEIPLDSRTRSGKVVDELENIIKSYNMSLYRTNVVKGIPLDDYGKLRYPKKKEIERCFGNLMNEIEMISPKVIILLGDMVRNSVEDKWKIEIKKPTEEKLPVLKYKDKYIISMYHPSYLLRSKKRKENNYKLFAEIIQKIRKEEI